MAEQQLFCLIYNAYAPRNNETLFPDMKRQISQNTTAGTVQPAPTRRHFYEIADLSGIRAQKKPL